MANDVSVYYLVVACGPRVLHYVASYLVEYMSINSLLGPLGPEWCPIVLYYIF